MKHGLDGLATVAATAPFLGTLGTLLGIFGSFKGVDGERTAIMAAIASELGDAMVPLCLGVAIALLALAAYRYLQGVVQDFSVEMENAILDLLNRLAFLEPRRERDGRRLL